MAASQQGIAIVEPAGVDMQLVMGPSKFLVAAISALALSGGVEGSRHRRRNGGGCSPKPIETTVTDVVEPTATSVTDIFEPTETSITDIIETTITDVVEPTETSITDIVETIETSITDALEPTETSVTDIIETAETTVTDVVEPTETSVTDIFEPTETTITDIVEPTETTATDTLEPVETIETTVTEIVIPIETVATDIETTETSVTEIIEPTPTPTTSIPDEESTTSIEVPVCTDAFENPNSDPNSVTAPDGSKYALITANQYSSASVQQIPAFLDAQSTYKLTFQWAYGQQQSDVAGCYFGVIAGGDELGEVQLTTGTVGAFTKVTYTFTPIADLIGFAEPNPTAAKDASSAAKPQAPTTASPNDDELEEGEEEDEGGIIVEDEDEDSDVDFIIENKDGEKAAPPQQSRYSDIKNIPQRTTSGEIASKPAPAKNDQKPLPVPLADQAAAAARSSKININAAPVYPRPASPSPRSTLTMSLTSSAPRAQPDLPENDKPWRKPGTDLSDYFNYGFDEFTWALYASKQESVRAEYNPDLVAASNKKMMEDFNNMMMMGGMGMPGGPGAGGAGGGMGGMPGMDGMTPRCSR
ncbi:unnamed protein product [Parascedosporium putredinis]|uniref:Pre-mRNA polyadenylation factor Fip1 domain-containing protein n=1 Tax=Parascedosporium putredinis TaxID=1442378 RepID=A0A9P1H0D0_9PEZI|nr:unnamed protein product [Parascedosporium putredinis]CAI7991677.1 unnamed protein product [Parascedosporium putredinis]